MRHRIISKITTRKMLYAEVALLPFPTLFDHFSKSMESKQHKTFPTGNYFLCKYSISLKYTVCVHCLMGFLLSDFGVNAMILIVHQNDKSFCMQKGFACIIGKIYNGPHMDFQNYVFHYADKYVCVCVFNSKVILKLK